MRKISFLTSLLHFEDGGGGGGGSWGGGGGGYGGGGPAPRDGDWTCPGCGANVFASKTNVRIIFSPVILGVPAAWVST